MRYENKAYFLATIDLDGNEYVDCAFEQCLIRFHGDLFSLVRPRFITCRLEFSGAADNTLQFLKILRAYHPETVETLLQERPPPGEVLLS